MYGSSYTQRRTREFDLLHDIVRQTRSAFIDVTRRPQPQADIAEDDGADRTERSVVYSKQLRQQQQQLTAAAIAATVAPVAGAATAASSSSSLLSSSLLSAHPLIPSLFSLPAVPANSSAASALAAVKAAGPSAAEHDWLRHRALQLSEAMAALELPDTGRIVLSFDEL